MQRPQCIEDVFFEGRSIRLASTNEAFELLVSDIDLSAPPCS